MRQRARYVQTRNAQQKEEQELRAAQVREVSQLLAEQADDIHSLMECVTAMVSLRARWAPPVGFEKQSWMTQLKKSRFHPSRELTEMQVTHTLP